MSSFLFYYFFLVEDIFKISYCFRLGFVRVFSKPSYKSYKAFELFLVVVAILIFIMLFKKLINFLCNIIIFSLLILFHRLTEKKLLCRLFSPYFLTIYYNPRKSFLVFPPTIDSGVKLISHSLSPTQLDICVIFLLLLYLLTYLLIKTIIILLYF